MDCLLQKLMYPPCKIIRPRQLLNLFLVVPCYVSCRRSFFALSYKSGLNRKICLKFNCSASSGDELGTFYGDSMSGSNYGSLPSEQYESSVPQFGTVNAEITQETVDFFVSDAEGDPDCPSKGFSPVDKAVDSLRKGEDARVGTSTGVSAADRAKTIVALSFPNSKPGDFRRPGHVFPLKYRSGGVLQRAGHTEASVDLVSLAGLRLVSALSTIIDPEDGSMARLPVLRKIAEEYGIPIISITDLIRYRRKREKLAERTAVSRLPTTWGVFKAYSYKSKIDGTEHVAIVKGEIGDGRDVLVRVHSECLTGDIFGSARCDCGNQLALAMKLIEKNGRGVLVYLRGHEGRGIGLGHKLRAYNLQDLGHDTVDANLELGLAADARDYGIGAQILRDLGVRTMRLMTNNPAKFTGLKGYGLAMIGRVPVISPITEENKRYLETKRTKMGHIYGSDLPGTTPGYDSKSDVEAD